MTNPCQNAITNLKIYYEKSSNLTLSKEDFLSIHDAVYNKDCEMSLSR